MYKISEHVEHQDHAGAVQSDEDSRNFWNSGALPTSRWSIA